MSELFSPPLFLTAVSIGCFCVGIIVGLLCARVGRQSELDASFAKGASQGKEEAEKLAQVQQEELAVSLADQFKGMREGIVQTVQAYQKAVDTCGEKLRLPESELLALNASPVPTEPEIIDVAEAELDADEDTLVAAHRPRPTVL